MGKKSRRKLGARRYADYSEETLSLAVDLVKTKALSSYEAEKQFGIPRRTILNRCKNEHDRSVGRPTELSVEDESHIADVVELVGEFGSPVSMLDLRLVVHDYLQKSGKTKLFNGKMPGERWVHNFLERHNFTPRATQNIKRSRAAKSTDELSKYYEHLETSIKDVPSKNILNFDETNLSDDPGSTKTLFKRGTKHPERVMNSSKTSISIMFSVTADGECLPPYVVYKAEHLWSRWCENGPPNARYNRTKSGWFDMACFDDWFKTIVLPWANSREGPKVIIGDNLSSHLSVEVVQLCRENNINLVFLPPNSTHLTQPLDVAFFGPMKKFWRKILLEYKISHSTVTTMNKTDFPQLLRLLMEQINMNSTSNIRNGFAASGIFPFDPSRVLRKIPVPPTEGTKQFDLALLEYLEKNRKSTTQTQTNRNKKLTVVPGKSVSVEDVGKCIKSKGKGKSTKKSNTNKDINNENFQMLQQPKSLKVICTQFVNEVLHTDEQSTKTRKKAKKRKTTTSNVRLLSKVSKGDKENISFTAAYNRDLPICLQTTEIIDRDNNLVTLSSPAQKSNVTVLSDVKVEAGPSNIRGSNTCKTFKDQHAKLKNRKPTTQTQTNRSKKLTVEPEKSVSKEDVGKSVKGKGKGKSSKKSNTNTDTNNENLQTLQQPKSLKVICTQFVKELLHTDNQSTKAGKKATKRKTATSNVRLLSKVSKSDKENIPFTAAYNSDLPIYLQMTEIIDNDNNPVTLSSPMQKSKITVLSDVKVEEALSNIRRSNTCKAFKNQNAKSKNIKHQGKLVSVGLSALRTKIIPKTKSKKPKDVDTKQIRIIPKTTVKKVESNKPKEVDTKRNKKEQLKKYKTKRASRYSESSTSISDEMSFHSDSSIIDLSEENSEDLPFCFINSRPKNTCDSTNILDITTLNVPDGPTSGEVLSETNSEDLPLIRLNKSRSPSTFNSNNISDIPNGLNDVILDDLLTISPVEVLSFPRNSTNISDIPNDLNDQILDDVLTDIARPALDSTKRSHATSHSLVEVPSLPIPRETNAEMSQSEPTFSQDRKDEFFPENKTSDNSEVTPFIRTSDTVLVRYYYRKTWKYYIGVVTGTNNETFDISFYTTMRNKGELKFKKPRRLDRDTVPKESIVKVIELSKISDKPEEYNLHDQDDAFYF